MADDAVEPGGAGAVMGDMATDRGRRRDHLDALPLHAIHRYTAITLFAFLALHVAGALFHQFILRDHLLSRMGFGLPWARPAGKEQKDVATEGGRAGGYATARRNQ